MISHSSKIFIDLLAETFNFMQDENMTLNEFDCISNLIVTMTFSRFNTEAEFNAVLGTKLGSLLNKTKNVSDGFVLQTSKKGSIMIEEMEQIEILKIDSLVVFQLQSLFDISIKNIQAARQSLYNLLKFETVWFLYEPNEYSKTSEKISNFPFSMKKLLKKWNEIYFTVTSNCSVNPCVYCSCQMKTSRIGNCEMCKMHSNSLTLFDGKHTRRITDEAANVMLLCEKCLR